MQYCMYYGKTITRMPLSFFIAVRYHIPFMAGGKRKNVLQLAVYLLMLLRIEHREIANH